MRTITKDELKHNPRLLAELKKSIFIYPTDTIYGIGCDAANQELVAKVRNIKKSYNQPFSIIIPNKNMIYEYCKTNNKTREWVDKLPGAYTLIMRLKNKKKRFFAPNVNPRDDTIGIRIPNHWFYKYVKKMKTPILTTSANITGGDFMTSQENLNPDLQKQVSFMINQGEIKGRPSTIVHLEGKKVKVQKR